MDTDLKCVEYVMFSHLMQHLSILFLCNCNKFRQSTSDLDFALVSLLSSLSQAGREISPCRVWLVYPAYTYSGDIYEEVEFRAVNRLRTFSVVQA